MARLQALVEKKEAACPSACSGGGGRCRRRSKEEEDNEMAWGPLLSEMEGGAVGLTRLK